MMAVPGSPLDRLQSRARRGFRGYPIATVAFYGPTNEFASKVAVAIVPGEDAEPTALERWRGESLDVRHDPGVAAAILAFLQQHKPRSVVMTQGIIGCPHEEGIDYPLGESCPRCPFWARRDRWKEI
jgi:hypothetical protein